jgi:hypothetical protein
LTRIIISHSVFIALDPPLHVYSPEPVTGGINIINIINEDAMGGFDSISKETTTPIGDDLGHAEKSLGRYAIASSQSQFFNHKAWE